MYELAFNRNRDRALHRMDHSARRPRGSTGCSQYALDDRSPDGDTLGRTTICLKPEDRERRKKMLLRGVLII